MALGAIYEASGIDADGTTHKIELLKEGGSGVVEIRAGNLGGFEWIKVKVGSKSSDFTTVFDDSYIEVSLSPVLESTGVLDATALSDLKNVRTGDARDYALRWTYGATDMGTYWVIPLAIAVELHDGVQYVRITGKDRIKSLASQDYPNALATSTSAISAEIATILAQTGRSVNFTDETRWAPTAHVGDPLDFW